MEHKNCHHNGCGRYHGVGDCTYHLETRGCTCGVIQPRFQNIYMRVFTCDFGGVPSAGGGGGSGGAGGCSESLIPLRQFASMLKESMEGSPENPIVIRGAGGYMYGYELYGFCPKGHGGYRYQRLPKHENEMTAEEMDVEIKKMSEVNMCSECGAHFTCAPYHD